METDGGGDSASGPGVRTGQRTDRREANTTISERVAHTGRRLGDAGSPEETQIQRSPLQHCQSRRRYVAGVWIRTDIPDRDGMPG